MPGGITFENVWGFQIKCMMSNQYENLVKALMAGKRELVIAACLRLGWNDAFRHTSKNNDDMTIIRNYLAQGWESHIKLGQKHLNDQQRADVFFEVCENLVEYFEDYAKKTSTADRYSCLNTLIMTTAFTDIIGVVKDTASPDKPLCIGHIQKMFNIAMKLILCLIESAEHARKQHFKVLLAKNKSGYVYLTDRKLLIYDNFPYAFDTADCPIDSIILKAIDNIQGGSYVTKPIGHETYRQVVWSKLGAKEPGENYVRAQNEIEDIQKGAIPPKSNLCFDFENWNI